MKDEEILRRIKNGGIERDQALQYLYLNSKGNKWRKAVVKYVRKNSGSKIDAETIEHDTLIAFDRKMINRPVDIKQSIHQYLIGIGKNLWLDVLRKRKAHRTKELDEAQLENTAEFEMEPFFSPDKEEYIKALVEKIAPECMQLLIFRGNKYSHEEIAKILNISKQTSKNKFSACIKKIKAFLREDAEWQKLLD
jgi:RNA polymerase sigma factor (sigma-70 family)